MFENIFGLSCIENQTLAILSESGIDIRPLYRDCAMPVKELFFFLIYHGNKLEYFDRITRVQDLARELGIINLELCGRPLGEKQKSRQPFPGAAPIGNYTLPPSGHSNINEIINDIRSSKENEYILARVKTNFTKTQLHARGLRDDHYVRIMAESDNFKIINDIPEVTITITAEEFSTAYGGDYFKLRIIRDITAADCKKIHTNRVFKPEKNTDFYFDISDFDPVRRFPNEPQDVGIRIRNMTGIYKILRQRMAEYYSKYTNTDFIGEQIQNIERHHSVFEYFNIKGNIPFEQYYERFEQLNELDNKLMRELKIHLKRAS